MTKLKKFFLMFAAIVSATFCYPNCIIENATEGVPILITKTIGHGGQDKSASISASIDGHTLVVVFTENLGSVDVAVSYAGGGTVDITKVITPSGYNIYIGATGSFVVRFTLSNGDEYTGEFEITE